MLSDKTCPTWILNHNKSFVGLCGFSFGKIKNLIYSIDNEWQGRGFGSEAAGAVLALTKGIFGPTTIELNIHSENLPSLRVAEKLNFTKAGSYRQQFPQDDCKKEIIYFHKDFQ